jgi:hypothetical protein
MTSEQFALGVVIVIIMIAVIGGTTAYIADRLEADTEIKFTEMKCPECGATLEFELKEPIEREVYVY